MRGIVTGIRADGDPAGRGWQCSSRVVDEGWVVGQRRRPGWRRACQQRSCIFVGRAQRVGCSRACIEGLAGQIAARSGYGDVLRNSRTYRWRGSVIRVEGISGLIAAAVEDLVFGGKSCNTVTVSPNLVAEARATRCDSARKIPDFRLGLS